MSARCTSRATRGAESRCQTVVLHVRRVPNFRESGKLCLPVICFTLAPGPSDDLAGALVDDFAQNATLT